MKRHLRIQISRKIVLVMLFTWAAGASAAGLGSLQLLSGLGQPLRATLPFSGDGTNDLGSACIKARLELYDGTYITTPRIGLSHTTQKGIIELSTKLSINEPIVVLHVEMGCRTPVYRNYQLLLDPVSFLPAVASAIPQKTTVKPLLATQHQAPSATPSAANNPEPLRARKRGKPISNKTAQENAHHAEQLPTLTKEIGLSSSSHDRKIKRSALILSSDTKEISEESITPVLKFTANLNPANNPEDLQKAEEFRFAQQRFAAIINGEDVTQNAETKMKAAQEQMLLSKAENARKKQHAQAEKLAQDAKRHESISIAWIAGFGALLLICVVAIAWLALKLFKAKKSSPSPSWKNYHAASDTLIADLSTQTLLDSDFLQTVGNTYTTTIFADSQFDQDTVAQSDLVEEAFEELDNTQPIVSNSITDKSGSNAPLQTETAAKENSNPPRVLASPPSAPAKKGLHQQVLNEIGHDVHGAPNRIALTLKVEEIADVMQKAEFWMLLQDPFRAIEILEPYRDVAHPESPVPWIYLLDLYRMVGDKNRYEALLIRIECIFNAKIPKWDGQFGITPRSLNDFPHIVEKICDLWESDEIVPYLESLLLDKRDGARDGFDLPVYRNIVQLITLAQEPEKSQQHEQLRYGKAQAILFSQQTPNLDHVAPTERSQPKIHSIRETSTTTDPVIKESASVPKEPAIAPQSATAATSATTVDRKTAPTELRLDGTKTSIETNATVASTEIDLAKNNPLNQPAIDPIATSGKPANDADEYGEASSMETKLELALVYQEIGEKDGARELLYEVIKGGTADQSEKAKSLLQGCD